MADPNKSQRPLIRALTWAGRIMFVALVLGLALGTRRCVAAEYFAGGTWPLVGSTLAASVGHMMAWGTLLAAVCMVSAVCLRALPTTATRRVGAALFIMFCGLILVVVWRIAAGFLERRLPSSYVGIGQAELLGSTIWPAVNLAVARFGWLVWTFILIVVALSLASSMILVSITAKLLKVKRPRPEWAEARFSRLWPGLFALLGWGLIAGLAPILKPTPPVGSPSVLLISIDTLRPDHMGCYGYQRPTSTNLDRFAGEAVAFEGAVSESPYTLPSHVSMLTGLNPLVHRVTTLDKKIPERTTMLSELFAAAGYDTGAAVSNFLLGPTFGFDQGFDFYEFYPDRAADAAVGAARRFFEGRAGSDRPCFFFLHLMDPHFPYTSSPEDRAAFEGADAKGFDQALPFFEFRDRYRDAEPESRAPLIAAYDAEIRFTDRTLNSLFDQLRALGLYDQMLIVVTSDHGEEFWEHGGLGHSVTLYDEVLRVPLIVRLPGAAHAGERVRGQVRLTDLAAFIALMAGLQLPGSAEGRDLMDTIVRGVRHDGPPALAMTDLFGPPRYARRTEELKWISPSRFKLGRREDVFPERLFDLRTDPAETTNLGPISPDLLDAISAQARREIEAVSALADARGPEAAPWLSQEAQEQLKALGYLQ